MRRPSAVVWFASVGLVACAGVLLARQASRTLPPRPPSPAPVPSDAASALRNLPLTFERNDGQFAPHVRFAGVQSNGSVAIHDNGFAIADVRSGMTPIAFTFDNALPGRAIGTDQRRTRSHYFSGSDRRGWHTDIPTFGRVRRDGLYPKIDAVYYGRDRQLEYDLVVRPGGDPRQVMLRVDGGRPRIDKSTGELVIEQNGRKLRQQRPVAYQWLAGARREIAANYVIGADDRVGVEVDAYDRTADLVIDPVVVYSTYLCADDMAVDSAGRVYLAGSTTPSLNRYTGTAAELVPATRTFGSQSSGIYVARLARSGADLEFSTFISATPHGWLEPLLALDAVTGAIYVTAIDGGGTAPITQGTTGPYPVRSFLTALSNDGNSIVWSRYVGQGTNVRMLAPRPSGGVALGGYFVSFEVAEIDPFGVPPTIGSPGVHSTWVLKVDAHGNGDSPAYVGNRLMTFPQGLVVGPDDSVTVVGHIYDQGLPVTPGALRSSADPDRAVGFITRFNPTQTAYDYSTYFGASIGHTGIEAVAVDDEGSTYVSGTTSARDAAATAPPIGDCLGPNCLFVFITKVRRDGTVAFSRQVGATSSRSGLALTTRREPIISFSLWSELLPLVSSVQPHIADNPLNEPSRGDIGLLKFSADGRHVLFSTYLGGGGQDRTTALRLDSSGNVYLQGITDSADFPVRGARRSFPLSTTGVDGFLTVILMRPPARADFDGDARTDVAIFRPSTGRWSVRNSRTNTSAAVVTLGQDGDIPAAADFDGDGQADHAVLRPSNGKWQIRSSRTLEVRTIQWGGTTADIPAPADYDGDGRADIAVFRPSNGYWYILQSSTNTGRYVQWGGTASDIPTAGDYDGDGKADIAFFRPSNGYWYLRRSTDGIQYVQWGGTAADVPAPGDYDGDGKTDVAFWRPSDNYWYIKSTATGAARYVRWGGVPTDVPVSGDYDQDGITDPAFFRASDGYWYILQSRTRTARYVNLGTLGDIPIPSRR